MMLALGASLCSASPCRQVDAHEEELPSVLPAKIFLSFPLLNLLSTFSSLSLAIITVSLLAATLGFCFSLCPMNPSCVCCTPTAAALPLWGFCTEPSPAGCSWHHVPEARPWLGLFLFAHSAVWWPQNGPAVEPPVLAPVICCRRGNWDQQHTKLGC